MKLFKAWVLLFSILSGCASVSNRNKTLLFMGGAFVGGATVGALRAPDDESLTLHGALVGGIAAATAGILGLFLFDEQGKRIEAEQHQASIQKEYDDYKKEHEPILLSEGNLGVGAPLPDEVKSLVKPGAWWLYKDDRWIQTNDLEIVHQNFIFRMQTPLLSPVSRSQMSNSK